MVGGAIIVAWIAGLAVLIRREYFRPQVERLAEAANDRRMLLGGHYVVGEVALWRGNLPEACARIERAREFYEGTEVGRASCEATVENNTTHYVEDSLPQKAKWARVECDFPNIKGSNTTGEQPEIFTLANNPGEYEFKLLWNNKLARSIKFTVQPGGKFDNGIATSNKLGSDIVIYPVQIIGDQDGNWNRTAWKTDAFYGNPLTGFTALP